MKKIIFLLIFLSSFSFSYTKNDPNVSVLETSWNPISYFCWDNSEKRSSQDYYQSEASTSDNSVFFEIYEGWIRNISYYTSYNLPCSTREHKSITYRICKDSTKKYNFQTGKCDLPYIPPVQCSENMKKSPDGTACVCKDGYNPDDVTYDDAGSITTINTCKPKKNCPPQMKYFWTDKATDLFGFQTEFAGCIPRTDLSEPDCNAQGGTYYSWAKDTSDGDLDSSMVQYLLTYGEGCVNEKYLSDEAFWANFKFLMSGFILHGSSTFPMNLASKAVKEEQLLLEYKNANLKQLEYKPNLQNSQPEVIDLTMGPDGVYADLRLNPKDASVSTDTIQTFNQWLKDNDLYGKNNPPFEYPSNPLSVDSSVSSAMNNMYKGGDEVSFSDGILGSQKLADKVDSFATMDESLNIGATKTSSIDLSSLLNNASNTKSFPVTSTVLEKTTSAAGEVTTKTLSKINYPDGTYSNVTTLARKFSDGTTKYDVAVSTPISTSNGIKNFEQSYAVTKNSSGQVTNKVVTKEPTLTYTGSDGHTTTASNTKADTATADKDLTTPLDLTNIQNALNQMNKTLTETKTLIKDAIEYVPANKADFDLALLNFKKGFSDFGLSLKDFLNFLGALPPIIDGFGDQLKDLLAMFDDKPDLSLPTGSCPFTAHWYGKYHEVDPCRYVYPYRPILVVFLTFFASWVIFLFVFKFMFRVNLRGE